MAYTRPYMLQKPAKSNRPVLKIPLKCTSMVLETNALHCIADNGKLRKVMGIKWPHKISNRTLYEKTGIRPLSQIIRERRWRLLGHIMSLPAECPARRAMRYFFEERSNRKFPGRKRTTIVTTLNKDIQLAKSKHSSFPVTPLISQVSLQNLHTKAKNRKLWSNIVKQVVDAAYSS